MRVLLASLLLVPAFDGQDQARSVQDPPAKKSLSEAPIRRGPSSEVLQRSRSLSRTAVLALVRLQDLEEGSFRLGDAKNPAPVAITALGVLALLSSGEVPGRTRHGAAIDRGLSYLLRSQDRSGGPRHGYIGLEQDRYSKMHGHAYATLALSQALGMLSRQEDARVTRAEVRKALIDAVRIIEKSQEPETGGWSYDPVPTDHEGSMTICMVQALRGAKNAGIEVKGGVIKKAIRYVERSQKPDGSVRYKLGSADSSVSLTAGAVATLEAAGDWKNPVLAKGRAFLVDQGLDARGRARRQGIQVRFPYYERLYVSQALFFDRDLTAFGRWYEVQVDRMARLQDPAKGTWASSSYSEAYATAMNLLVLTMPLALLPIHQR